MKQIAGVLAVLCGMTLVTSTPILPTRDLGEIDPVDACLFLCNICFDQNAELMMRCANRVCLNEYMIPEYSLFIIKELCPPKDDSEENFKEIKH